MSHHPLTARERKVLEAVVQSYVETAEPAGSRTIARQFGLGVSAATVRNTMSDLEEKGYLFHPHTSAGRIPTDLAYRLYVDALMPYAEPSRRERETIREELRAESSAVNLILRRAAQVLGVLTMELGVAAAPSLDDVVLERLELLTVATGRLLLVLSLKSGVVRTIFVDVPGSVHPNAVVSLAVVLNDRLAGLTLREIRQTLPERLRDAADGEAEAELLNIFIATREQIFELRTVTGDDVMLGQTSILAEQPEFASGERMRELVELTERRDVLRSALEQRARRRGLTITIGGENPDQKLSHLTLVTSTYRLGPLSGVIGVIGPTRMPYEKVVALVEHTSRMVGDLLS